MAEATVLYERQNSVGYLTLNRPEAMNSLTPALMADLEAAVEVADLDDEVKVLVVKGNGRAFCAGYDLEGAADGPPDPDGSEGATASGAPTWESLHRTMYSLRRNGDWWLKLLWNLKKPVVAQVHGYCVAGGNDLAGCCDLIIAADDAQFGMPQARALGLPHTFGLMPLTIGMLKTKELAFTGDTISGVEAERIGLINRAVPFEDLDEVVRTLAERISLMPMELLLANKWAINRFFEIMGVDAMVRCTNEWGAIGAQNPRLMEFARIAARDGVRAAIEFRDAPWKDYTAGNGRTPMR